MFKPHVASSPRSPSSCPRVPDLMRCDLTVVLATLTTQVGASDNQAALRLARSAALRFGDAERGGPGRPSSSPHTPRDSRTRVCISPEKKKSAVATYGGDYQPQPLTVEVQIQLHQCRTAEEALREFAQ